MGRQMDHRLAHGRFQLRNVSTWNCSTIRSPWADSCFKRASPSSFPRIFPTPCGIQVSLFPGRCSWHIQAGSRLRTDVCNEDPGLLAALPRSCLEHMAALCSVSMLFPIEPGAGRRQRGADFPSLQQAAGKRLGCPHPGDRKLFWIHQFKTGLGLVLQR